MNTAFERISPLSWRSLQTRLTLISVAVVVLCVTALALLVGYRLQSEIELRLGQQQYGVVSLFSQEIDDGLRERMRALENAARQMSRQPPDPRQLQASLENQTALWGLFSGGVYVTDTRGMALASVPTAATRMGQIYPDATHRPHTAANDSAIVSAPAIDRSYGAPVVTISAPIRDAKGQVWGSLSGAVDLARPNFMSHVFSMPHGQSGGFFLVDNASRKIVGSSDPIHMLREIASAASNPQLDRFVAGASGVARMDDLRTQASLSAAAQIPSANWTLLVTLPLSEAFAPARNLTQAMLAASMVLALLSLALNTWLVRRQLAPAHAASKAMRQHAREGGELQPLPVIRNDEIGQLIEGINAMLLAVKARDTILESSEVALQQSTGVLREAQHLAHVGNWTLDIPSGALHWSDEIYRIFEIDPDRFAATYQGFLNAVHPDDRARVHAAYTASLQNGGQYQTEHRLRMADGRIKWVQERAHTEFDAEGFPLRTSGTVQDITERKMAEAALAETNDLLRNIIESVPMRIFWKDRALNYLGCNTLFAQDSGLRAPEALIGKSDYQMGWAELAELYRNDDNEVIATGRAKPFYEEEVVSASGQRMWVRTAKVPLLDKQGQVTGVLGVYDDVTTEKTLAQELERHRHHLEELVGQRTAELEAARQTADQANRTKSEFLANMSHEIRTPMNGVIGMVDVLQHTPLSTQQKHMVTTIQQSSLELLNIVNDILDFSKIEAGKVQLEILPTALRKLAPGCANLMQDVADKRGVQLRVVVDDGVPELVLTDPTRLRQILLNLMSNAIKFAPAKGGRAEVQLSVTDTAAHGESLVLQVRDNGMGIEPGVLDRLFQPFTQGDASTMRQFGGTGLGLSITQRLVELLEGDIRVTTAPGQGSCFTVQWPLVRGEPLADAPQAPAEPEPQPLPVLQAPSVEQARQAGRLVLLVEDNEINRDVISQQLALLGYASDAAADGVEALEKLQAGGYGLLLTDCHMPRMDGFALAQAVRASEQGSTRHLPIIAVTANALQGEAERCKSHGMDDYLSKPLRLPQLSAMLQRWLPSDTPPRLALAQDTDTGSAQPVPADLPLFDAQALTRLIGADASVQQRLLGKFLLTLQAQHAAVNAALQAHDADGLESAAHTLKSAARSVGTLALGELCFALESAARAKQPARYESLVSEFNTAVQQAQAAITAHLASSGH